MFGGLSPIGWLTRLSDWVAQTIDIYLPGRDIYISLGISISHIPYPIYLPGCVCLCSDQARGAHHFPAHVFLFFSVPGLRESPFNLQGKGQGYFLTNNFKPEASSKINTLWLPTGEKGPFQSESKINNLMTKQLGKKYISGELSWKKNFVR